MWHEKSLFCCNLHSQQVAARWSRQHVDTSVESAHVISYMYSVITGSSVPTKYIGTTLDAVRDVLIFTELLCMPDGRACSGSINTFKHLRLATNLR